MVSTDNLLQIISIQTDIAKQGLDLGNTMNLVVEQSLTLVAADGAVIELAEEDEMVYSAVAGSAKGHLGLRIKREDSLSGLCLRQGEILYCEDTETDNRVDLATCRLIGLRSMIVVPLNHKQETVGVLKAFSAVPGKFTQDDLTLLRLMSDVVAAAMYYSTKYNINQLFYQATHDEMTGLANRALFIDRLRVVLAQNQRYIKQSSVLMVDMDGLKRINDTYGHRIGDAAIREFSNRLKTAARHSDTVARLGGDEFGIILSPVDLSVGIEAIIQRIYAEISKPMRFEGADYPLAASIGAADYPTDGSSIDILMEIADKRMYKVKKQRKLKT